jgi:hypothetical protein
MCRRLSFSLSAWENKKKGAKRKRKARSLFISVFCIQRMILFSSAGKINNIVIGG